ncbi:MAG: hypothetical protein ABI613_11010 [Gemmatimonadota bacterium]
MYRIKLASGNETTCNSIDELTDAIQAGEIDGGALIYHQRADRWLSVTNHPHYQIALSRIQSPARPNTADGSKRQVVNAVRPAASQATAPQPSRNDTEIPQTAARAQLLEVVAEMESARAPKKLTIPQPRKPDAPAVRAHESVMEGVVVPKAAPNGNGNGQSRPNGNGAHAANGNGAAVGHQTTAMPYRGTVIPSQAPKIPDLGDGLDLVEPEAGNPRATNGKESHAPVKPAPLTHPESSTPQVDKLLSLLEPAPIRPDRPDRPDPMIHQGDPEIFDLTAPAPIQEPYRRTEPVLNGPIEIDEAAKLDIHHAPEIAHTQFVKRKRSPKPALVGIAAAAVLVIGIVAWHPWNRNAGETPSVASAEVPRTQAFGGMSSVETPVGSVATTGGTPTPVTPAPDSSRSARNDSAPDIIRVAAPRVNMSIPLPTGQLVGTTTGDAKNSIPAANLVQHYGAAYADARSELELRMLQIGFTQMFLRSRLTTTSGLQDTRRLIGSANSALRQYRSQETRIEQAYQDTVGSGGRNLDWTPRDLGTWNTRASQREGAETLRLTNLLLTQMDSVFSLLQDQDGKYQWSGDAIDFDDADAARQYGALRAWLNQQSDNYGGSGEAALPGTLRQVIKAIGNSRLPQERRK